VTRERIDDERFTSNLQAEAKRLGLDSILLVPCPTCGFPIDDEAQVACSECLTTAAKSIERSEWSARGKTP